MKRSILLIGGLPRRPELPTSFERQLTLLAGFFRRTGWRAKVLGPEPEAVRREMRGRGATGIPAAAILLGYPDQFRPLLEDRASRVPLYLWAQCSRPPDPSSFGAARAVPLTPKTKEFLEEAGVPGILPVVPHAVDTDFFRLFSSMERGRAKRSFGVGGSFVVGAVGANTARKRFDLIMEAFRIFASRRSDAVLFLKTDRIVGVDGRDLQAISARLGIEGRTTVLSGELSSKRMRALYNAFDVLVNLSEWEGFCLPVAEAMSCGVPVVTHRIQGPGELVPYGELVARDSVPYEEGGSLLLQARPETAAALMTRVAEDEALRRRLGEEGRAKARDSYDVYKVMQRWERQLISRFPPTGTSGPDSSILPTR